MQFDDVASPEPCLPPNQSGLEDTVRIFRKYLTSEWTRRKTPYGLDGALAKAADSSAVASDRIFLNAGFAAWVAYFLATSGERHYEGRHAQLQAITAFDERSVDERTLVATRVAEIVPHATVRRALEKMVQDPKRRRLLSPATDQESHEVRYSAYHSLSPAVIPHPSLPQQGSTANLNSPQHNVHLTSGMQQQTLSHASLQGTADVFPEYMSGAIRRDSIESGGSTCWRAAITMTFPYLGKVDCLMSLAIRETKVEYIAMALFNVHVDVEPAVMARQVVLRHGVRLMPNPEISLQGVCHDGIRDLFGVEIHEAIKASRVCQEELQQGTRATRCVSMIIPSNPDVGAVINLNLGLKEGSRVRDKLYRRLPDTESPYN